MANDGIPNYIDFGAAKNQKKLTASEYQELYDKSPKLELVRCKSCKGTGWAQTSIHPVLGVIFDPSRLCQFCNGLGEDWTGECSF